MLDGCGDTGLTSNEPVQHASVRFVCQRAGPEQWFGPGGLATVLTVDVMACKVLRLSDENLVGVMKYVN